MSFGLWRFREAKRALTIFCEDNNLDLGVGTRCAGRNRKGVDGESPLQGCDLEPTGP